VSANHIARWDGSDWHALGDGVDNGVDHWVLALAVDGGGNLYAGGDFTTAGGVSANRIARWDGSSWHPLGDGGGNGVDHWVFALAVDGSGNLYAGGTFTTAGGVSANHIARWDGLDWHALGDGVDGTVYALAVDGGGSLYAGGTFTTAGEESASRIARWEGGSWSPLGDGMGGSVYALAVDGGSLYAGGIFTTAGEGSANRIACWDGGSWSPLGSGVSDAVRGLAVDGGNLYVGGEFTTAGEKPSAYIARWSSLAGGVYLPLIQRGFP
jgi:hypothetical protein